MGKIIKHFALFFKKFTQLRKKFTRPPVAAVAPNINSVESLLQSFGIHHKCVARNIKLELFSICCQMFCRNLPRWPLPLWEKMSKHLFATNPSFSLLLNSVVGNAFRGHEICDIFISAILRIRPDGWKAVVISTRVCSFSFEWTV